MFSSVTKIDDEMQNQLLFFFRMLIILACDYAVYMYTYNFPKYLDLFYLTLHMCCDPSFLRTR